MFSKRIYIKKDTHIKAAGIIKLAIKDIVNNTLKHIVKFRTNTKVNKHKIHNNICCCNLIIATMATIN